MKKTIKIVIVTVLMFAGICYAPTYKENIGVFQKDSAGSHYMNIGADQTDAAAAAPSGQIIIISGDD